MGPLGVLAREAKARTPATREAGDAVKARVWVQRQQQRQQAQRLWRLGQPLVAHEFPLRMQWQQLQLLWLAAAAEHPSSREPPC